MIHACIKAVVTVITNTCSRIKIMINCASRGPGKQMPPFKIKLTK